MAAALFGVAMLLLTTRELLRRRMRLTPYLFWAAMWVGLILVVTVPQAYSTILFITQVLGMYTPIHVVTTFSILALFVLVYHLGKRTAELDEKLSVIIQNMALQNVGEHPNPNRDKK